MKDQIVERYECSECGKVHDEYYDATECCPTHVFPVFVCPGCGNGHHNRSSAKACLASHPPALLDIEHCPNCMRPADMGARVDIFVAGHCSTCSPNFSIDERMNRDDLMAGVMEFTERSTFPCAD